MRDADDVLARKQQQRVIAIVSPTTANVPSQTSTVVATGGHVKRRFLIGDPWTADYYFEPAPTQ